MRGFSFIIIMPFCLSMLALEISVPERCRASPLVIFFSSNGKVFLIRSSDLTVRKYRHVRRLNVFSTLKGNVYFRIF